MDTVYLSKDMTVAAGAGEDHYFTLPSGGTKWMIEKITIVPRVAVAANGTNHWTLAIKNTDAEAGTPDASMGGLTTDSGESGAISLAVNDKVVITPTANHIVSAGGSLLLDLDGGGTPPAAFDASFLFELRKLRAPA